MLATWSHQRETLKCFFTGKGEYSTIRHFKRDRDHFHIPFITVFIIVLFYYYFNLLLCLIYELSIDMYA